MPARVQQASGGSAVVGAGTHPATATAASESTSHVSTFTSWERWLNRSSAVLNIASTVLMFVPGADAVAGVVKLAGVLGMASVGVAAAGTALEGVGLLDHDPSASWKDLALSATGLLPSGSIAILRGLDPANAGRALWNALCVGSLALNTAIAGVQGVRIADLIHHHQGTGEDWLYLASALAGVLGSAHYAVDGWSGGGDTVSQETGAGGGGEGPALRIARNSAHMAIQAHGSRLNAALATNASGTDPDQRRQIQSGSVLAAR